MNASSQNPATTRPPELTPVPPPMPDQVRAAYAAYGVALPYVPEPAAESATEATDPCDDCLRGKHGPNAHRRGLPAAEEAPASVTTLQAAAAVMNAAMEENKTATVAELAEAERKAGILFDAEHVEAVRTAALEQARADCEAEIHEARRQLAAIAGSRRQVEAVLRLCEGRRGDDMLLVSAVAVAAEAATTALDAFPMTLVWDEDQGVQLPGIGAHNQQSIVSCVSAYGGRADLVLTGQQRERLAHLLGLQTRAGHELAAADQVDETAVADGQSDEDAAGEAEAACARCGCTESRACEGGCHWVPNVKMIDLCSACATPEELAYAAGGLR